MSASIRRFFRVDPILIFLTVPPRHEYGISAAAGAARAKASSNASF